MTQEYKTNLKAKQAINKLTAPWPDDLYLRTLNVYKYTLEALDETVKAVNS